MKTTTFYVTKKLFVIVCCFAFMAKLKSQTFSILPANTQTVTFSCDSSTQSNKIYISNPTSNSIGLSYTVISNTLPLQNDLNGEGGCWDYMFCDWQHCKNGLPIGTFTPAIKIPKDSVGGTMSSMILDITTYYTKGQGSFVLTLFETSNPSNSQTVTWNVIGCTTGNECTASVDQSSVNTSFSVHPNPAGDVVSVDITSNYFKGGSIQVYNLVGERLIELNGIKNNVQEINLQQLPAGAYFVKYDSGQGSSVKKLLKIK